MKRIEFISNQRAKGGGFSFQLNAKARRNFIFGMRIFRYGRRRWRTKISFIHLLDYANK